MCPLLASKDQGQHFRFCGIADWLPFVLCTVLQSIVNYNNWTWYQIRDELLLQSFLVIGVVHVIVVISTFWSGLLKGHVVWNLTLHLKKNWFRQWALYKFNMNKFICYQHGWSGSLYFGPRLIIPLIVCSMWTVCACVRVCMLHLNIQLVSLLPYRLWKHEGISFWVTGCHAVPR
jgi:hypothetical protein